MKLKNLLKEQKASELYTDWEEIKNPDSIKVTLKNGKTLEISKKNIPNGSRVYGAILQAFIDDRFDITDKVVAAMVASLKSR